MDDKKKKKFIVPEAEIIDFAEEDIITGSGLSEGDDLENWINGGGAGDNW